ncbi:WG repeat-containing protein [Longitalea arenae]|uniref:WG repeat-containing protein n=1 Tax=Longitalea arenae TaxID=2812558 RepID=UPI001967A56E|nr:WG repeat-containing protein [Longitalea arenae]
MRKFLLVLGLLSTLFVNAQTKRPAAKKKETKKEEKPVKKVVPVEKAVEVVQDIEVVEEPKVESISIESVKEEGIVESVMAPVMEEVKREETKTGTTSNNSTNVVDGEPFYIYTSYREKNLIIAHTGADYENKRYALLEFFSKKKITPFIFENISSFYDSDLSQVKLNSKHGVINTKGQIIIPCIYDEMSTMTIDGMVYYVVNKGGRDGVINAQNETVIPFEYDNLRKSYNSSMHLEISKGGKYGLMNFVSRKMVIPAIYDRIDVLSNNLVQVRKGNQYTLFNLSGEQVFSNWYTQLDIYIDGDYALVELNGKKGVISIAEKKIIPLDYDVMTRLRSGYSSSKVFFITAKGGKYGIMGNDGKVVLPLQYTMITSTGYDLVTVTKANKKGLLSTEGASVLPVEYDEIIDADRYLLVKKAGKWGVVNRSGVFILPVEYDALTRMYTSDTYNTPYLLATKNGKKGVIDAITGKPRIDFVYDDLIGYRKYSYSSTETFNNSIIAVKNGKYGMVEINGTVLLPFNYDDLQYMNSFLVIAGKGGKYGVVDIYNNNNVVLPFEYQFVNCKNSTVIAYKDSYEKYRVSGNKITKDGK